METKALIQKGIESLRESVAKDIIDSKRYERPMRGKHEFLRKYRWILRRADQYAKAFGSTRLEVLAAWESKRRYWYMNFYQECNQPEIKIDGKMRVLKFGDWMNELKEKFGNDSAQWKFKCPSCGHIQCGADFEAIGQDRGNASFNCIGRHKKGVGCDWSLGGLLQIHSTVVVKELQLFPVFEMA